VYLRSLSLEGSSARHCGRVGRGSSFLLVRQWVFILRTRRKLPRISLSSLKGYAGKKVGKSLGKMIR
jgi:hypothetical protein